MFVGWQRIINTITSGNRLILIVLQKWNSRRKFARISNIFRSIWCLIAVPWLRIHTMKMIFFFQFRNSFTFLFNIVVIILHTLHAYPFIHKIFHFECQPIETKSVPFIISNNFFLFKEIFMSCYHAHISSANIACLTM